VFEEIVDVSFTYRNKLYSLRCQILDEEIAYTIPKPLENLTDIDMSSTKVASKKRKQSKSRSRSLSQNSLTSASEGENGSCSEAGPKTSKEQPRTKKDSNKSKSPKIESKKSNSSIADVIPQVLLLIQYWDKVEVSNNEAKELCYFLIHFVRIKFKYELESPIYQVKSYDVFKNF
jgi:hypothetical protein